MKNKRKKNSELSPVGDILAEIMQSIRKEAPSDLLRIKKVWNSALDPAISTNAQPAALKGSSLLVHTASPTVTYQLRFIIPDIINRLNTAIGEPMIREIKCKVGTLTIIN